jgi:hypothetical protein
VRHHIQDHRTSDQINLDQHSFTVLWKITNDTLLSERSNNRTSSSFFYHVKVLSWIREIGLTDLL